MLWEAASPVWNVLFYELRMSAIDGGGWLDLDL